MDVSLDALGVFAVVSLNGSKNLMLRADQIRSERTGIHAAISVFYNSIRLAYDTFNVARNEERKRLANEAFGGLGAAVQKVYPREALKNDLDTFCADVWDAWQQRDPAVEIWTDRDVELTPPAWLLEPLILENQPNFLFGEPSATKSLTAEILAATLCLQWVDNPFRVKPPASYWETLYLDFERNEAIITFNLSRLQRGMDLPGIPMHYKRLHGPLARNVGWAQKYLRAHPKIHLIIIDSVTPASGGNLNETTPVSEFFDAERALNSTTLCLAHASNKDPEAKNKTITGSFAWSSYAGNVWECRKEQEESSDIAEVCLYHRKAPAVYGLHKPIGYRINFTSDKPSLSVSPSDPRTVPSLIERMGLTTRVVQALKRSPHTIAELSEELGESKNKINTTVQRLRAKGIATEICTEGKAIRWGLRYKS